MLAVEDIRAKLAAVDAGELPLWDFYAWLEIASLNMHRDSAREAMKLVGGIKLLFADYDSGEIDESELRDSVCGLGHPVTIYRPAAAADIDVQFTPLKLIGGVTSRPEPILLGYQYI